MNLLSIVYWSLSLFLAMMTFLFIFRIVLTWYPQVGIKQFPWILITLPTEFLLIPVRKIISPIGGIDISPIVWVGICSFLREVLVGQQGLISMALDNH